MTVKDTRKALEAYFAQKKALAQADFDAAHKRWFESVLKARFNTGNADTDDQNWAEHKEASIACSEKQETLDKAIDDYSIVDAHLVMLDHMDEYLGSIGVYLPEEY